MWPCRCGRDCWSSGIDTRGLLILILLLSLLSSFFIRGHVVHFGLGPRTESLLPTIFKFPSLV